MKYLSVSLFLALASAQAAQAACYQVEATGTWITYQAAFLTADNTPHVGQCKLIVGTTGNIDKDKSSCKFVTFNTPDLPTGGTFKVKSDCSADINLTLGEWQGQVQLEPALKNSYSGRFSAQGGNISGTTSAIKR
jgi:hypothetical protein